MYVYICVNVCIVRLHELSTVHCPLQVDGVRKRLPYSVPLSRGGAAVVSAVGSAGTSLTTDFGLRVTFDGLSRLAVHVAASYAGSLCGLCGNYDGTTRSLTACPTS